jgi:hypothetical protein
MNSRKRFIRNSLPVHYQHSSQTPRHSKHSQAAISALQLQLRPSTEIKRTEDKSSNKRKAIKTIDFTSLLLPSLSSQVSRGRKEEELFIRSSKEEADE